jgi:hypothetical protein
LGRLLWIHTIKGRPRGEARVAVGGLACKRRWTWKVYLAACCSAFAMALQHINSHTRLHTQEHTHSVLCDACSLRSHLPHLHTQPAPRLRAASRHALAGCRRARRRFRFVLSLVCSCSHPRRVRASIPCVNELGLCVLCVSRTMSRTHV